MSVQSQKLVYFLYELLWRHVGEITLDQRDQVNECMSVLQQLNVTPLRLGSQLTQLQLDDLLQVRAITGENNHR